MSPTTPRRHAAARILAATATAAAVSVALGAGLGPAAAAANRPMPQTREHVLLGRPVVPTTSTDGDVCSDWTDEDGSDGTNCPQGGGGGISHGGDFLVWIDGIPGETE